jgi:uncharacterized protein YjdB
MLERFWPRALFLIALMAPIAGCTNQLVDTITVTPSAQTVAVGQTFQFTATGTIGHGSNHPSTTSNITNQVAWTSSVPSVATISSSGIATAVASGSTTITATINGYTGVLSASSTLTVAGSSGGTGTVTGITSLSVIPGSQTVNSPGQTSQFIAIGTNASGATVNITNQVAWSSSSVQIATVGGNTGLATAVGQGTVTITAIYTNPGGGSTIAGTGSFTVASGNNEQFTKVQIIPGSQAVSASGQTGQFIALATIGSNGLEEDVTNSPSIIWLSSIPTIATVTSGLATGNGVVAGVSQGSTNVTVELKNSDGSIVTAQAGITVTLTPAPEPLLSLQIIPGSISVGNLQDTGQFLAIGTYSTSPAVRDLTNAVTWQSSEPNVFPVLTNGTGIANPGADAGVVTAEGTGDAVIIAEATDPTTGSIQSATATFSCPLVLPTATTAGSCYPGSQAPALLATITVYNEGLNTTSWLVTAPSATNTPDVLHCGPGSNAAGFGGSVCVASYPIGSAVILTAPATSAAFGGWSYNCTPLAPNTAAGPNSCEVFLTTNDTVGAIFN